MPALDDAVDRRLATLRDLLSAPDADACSVDAAYRNLFGWTVPGLPLPAGVLFVYLLTGTRLGSAGGQNTLVEWSR